MRKRFKISILFLSLIIILSGCRIDSESISSKNIREGSLEENKEPFLELKTKDNNIVKEDIKNASSKEDIKEDSSKEIIKEAPSKKEKKLKEEVKKTTSKREKNNSVDDSKEKTISKKASKEKLENKNTPKKNLTVKKEKTNKVTERIIKKSVVNKVEVKKTEKPKAELVKKSKNKITEIPKVKSVQNPDTKVIKKPKSKFKPIWSTKKEVKYTTHVLNVRTQPNTISRIIKELNVNTRVEVYKLTNVNGWYKLSNQNGFISGRYLTDKEIIVKQPEVKKTEIKNSNSNLPRMNNFSVYTSGRVFGISNVNTQSRLDLRRREFVNWTSPLTPSKKHGDGRSLWLTIHRDTYGHILGQKYLWFKDSSGVTKKYTLVGHRDFPYRETANEYQVEIYNSTTQEGIYLQTCLTNNYISPFRIYKYILK